MHVPSINVVFRCIIAEQTQVEKIGSARQEFERNLAPFEFLPRTTDLLYLRLLGDYATKYDVDGGHMHRYEKLLWKREAALESWSLKIERHLAEVRSVWTFVSNHFEGFAPETAQRLAQRLGYDLPLPSETERILSEQERSQLDLL